MGDVCKACSTPGGVQTESDRDTAEREVLRKVLWMRIASKGGMVFRIDNVLLHRCCRNMLLDETFTDSSPKSWAYKGRAHARHLKSRANIFHKARHHESMCYSSMIYYAEQCCEAHR